MTGPAWLWNKTRATVTCPYARAVQRRRAREDELLTDMIALVASATPEQVAQLRRELAQRYGRGS